jgi:hypothetical protein
MAEQRIAWPSTRRIFVMALIDDLRQRDHVPRFHGNGFAQLYLTPNKRLHVWNPALPATREHNATVHDHIWDMQSRVLHGKLTNIVYDMIWEASGNTTFHYVNQDAVRAGTGDFYEPSNGTYTMWEEARQELPAGSQYSLLARRFHQSVATRAVSLMTKGPDKMGRPRIISPVGEVPTNAFDPATQPSEEKLWAVIASALDDIGHSNQCFLKEEIANV